LALATTTDHVGDQDENDELKKMTLKDLKRLLKIKKKPVLLYIKRHCKIKNDVFSLSTTLKD
jgi:hypothetical protein